MSEPTFSVIVPTYNRGYILWKTLLSLQQQIYTNFEVLVIDDGSTDDTLKVMSLFQDDSRFIYHHQSHQGVSAARQLGFEHARGSFVSYIDSDDPVYPTYLKTAKNYFLSNEAYSFCLSNCNFYVDLLDESRKVLASKHIITHSDVTLDDIYHWKKRIALGTGLFLKKEIFNNRVAWNTTLPCFEDLDFVMQLALVDPEGYFYIPEILFDYHQCYGLDGICSSMTYQQWSEAFKQLLELHSNDVLLREPHHYHERIAKYAERQIAYEKGEYPPAHLKYFPEFLNEC